MDHTSRLPGPRFRLWIGPTVAVALVLAALSCGSHDEPSLPATGTYRVVLTTSSDEPVRLIKTVREITGLGLRDAKDMVDGAPTIILQNLTQDAARAVARKLEAAGGTVEVRPQTGGD